MNIILIRSNKRKNSTTYNSAEYLISKLENVDKVYEFTLPEDMPHICCGCYACIKGDEEKCGGYKYLKPILDAFDDSSLIIFCSPVYVGHIPGQIKSFLDHFGYRWLVHPRSPGEYKSDAHNLSGLRGSPLLTRGILFQMEQMSMSMRFTPAHAVNTTRYDLHDLPGKVHPRSRGEYNIIMHILP